VFVFEVFTWLYEDPTPYSESDGDVDSINKDPVDSEKLADLKDFYDQLELTRVDPRVNSFQTAVPRGG